MIVFKGCNKCAGDLYIERDISGMDLVCLQCGYRSSLRSWIDEAPQARRQELSSRELQELGV
jgi:DNA-directed RNA polymerase subunit M/transcription elongation factor TFIIS